MDTLCMRLLGASTPPAVALNVLRDARQSALIVEDGGKYSLAWASDIDDARRSNLPSIKAIPNREPVHLATLRDAKKHGVDLFTPRKTWQQYETMLDAVGAKFAVIAVDQVAFVVTRHEDLRSLAGSVSLECPNGHLFPNPEKRVDDECPRCPADASGERPRLKLSE